MTSPEVEFQNRTERCVKSGLRRGTSGEGIGLKHVLSPSRRGLTDLITVYKLHQPGRGICCPMASLPDVQFCTNPDNPLLCCRGHFPHKTAAGLCGRCNELQKVTTDQERAKIMVCQLICDIRL